MDNNVKAVFELCPTAMIAVANGKIELANHGACRLFARQLEGLPAAAILPEHILANSAANFTSTALINDKPCGVSVSRIDEKLFMSMTEEVRGGCGYEFVSDSLLNALLSSLFNIALAIDRIEAETEGKSSEKMESYLAVLKHSYYSLRHSLLNLSTSVALRKGTLPCSFRAVELASLCSDLVSTVSVMCSRKAVNIDFSTPLGELYACADGEKLECIILNLITNSLQHSSPGGKITVGLEKSGDNAYISVTDSGCGIPLEKMALLFTGGERGSDSPDLCSLSAGGLGLGVARGLAEIHGGALIMESREGNGTRVRVMIPLKSAMLSTLESGGEYSNSGMSLILTVMAPVLDSESYTRKYTD